MKRRTITTLILAAALVAVLAGAGCGENRYDGWDPVDAETKRTDKALRVAFERLAEAIASSDGDTFWDMLDSGTKKTLLNFFTDKREEFGKASEDKRHALSPEWRNVFEMTPEEVASSTVKDVFLRSPLWLELSRYQWKHAEYRGFWRKPENTVDVFYRSKTPDGMPLKSYVLCRYEDGEWKVQFYSDTLD